MKNWNREKIVSLLFECAQKAVKIKNSPHTVIKADRTPVTDADKLVEKLLTENLSEPENGVRIIGEETFAGYGTDYLNEALKGTTWIIDPIDGTANFASGHYMWGISIGFAQNGIIQEGGVYIPELGDLMITDGPHVLYTRFLNPPDAETLNSHLTELHAGDVPFTDSGTINISQIIGKLGKIKLVNPVLCVGSCIYAAVTLARGLDLAYISQAKLWDWAGVLPSLKRLGFTAESIDGSDFDMMSGRISGDIFDLDYSAKLAFRMKKPAIFTRSTEIAGIIRNACEMP